MRDSSWPRAPLDATSLALLRQVVHAVDAVETMRTSENLLIAGPVREDPLRRRAWLNRPP